MNNDTNSQKLTEMRAQIRKDFQAAIDAIDLFLNYLTQPLDKDHPEAYEKFNWETRTGKKGQFQMLRKENCNDTQLFSHLETILNQNKNNITIGNYNYWTGKPGYIFRRKSQAETQ